MTVDELFSADFLRRLESLSLAARYLVKGRSRAQRRATSHGASVEFAEYRPLSDGDDWRYIDWNAFARWRQLVLKLFVEEEDWHIHLLIDNSRSVDFGIKYDYIRQATAGLAYLGLANLDRVSVVPLQSRRADIWPASRGRDRFLQLLRHLTALPIRQEAKNMEESIRLWLSTKPRRGLVVVLSDLWGADTGDAIRALDRLCHARHEVAIIQVTEPSEKDAGQLGEYTLEDCETGESHHALIDAKARREYQKNYQDYQEEIFRYCRRRQIALIQTDTDFNVIDLLLRSLQSGGFVE